MKLEKRWLKRQLPLWSVLIELLSPRKKRKPMDNNDFFFSCLSRKKDKKDNKQVKIVGYGLLSGKEMEVEVLRETKTTITGKWGNGSMTFSKRTGHAMPTRQYDIWSGWRLDDENKV